MQENEDDDMNIDPSKDVELSEMLEGKNEHLYQRILYLVLADAAYFEGINAYLCRDPFIWEYFSLQIFPNFI